MHRYIDNSMQPVTPSPKSHELHFGDSQKLYSLYVPSSRCVFVNGYLINQFLLTLTQETRETGPCLLYPFSISTFGPPTYRRVELVVIRIGITVLIDE